MARVLLKRNMFCDFGRFAQSRMGVPTEIPDIVIKRLDDRAKANFIRKDNGTEAEWKKKLEMNPHPGLPSDARVVGAEYKTPAEVEAETGGASKVPLTDAEIQEKIAEEAEKRAQEILAKIEAERNEKRAEAAAKAAQAEEDGEGEPEEGGDGDGDGEGEPEEGGDGDGDGEDILDMSVSDIVARLSDLEYDELKDLLAREQDGKTRKTLVVEIEAALAEFE